MTSILFCIPENMFACLFSVHNTTSLSRHEQVWWEKHRIRWWEKHLSKRSLIKHTYSLRNSEILPHPIQMQFSKKQMSFQNVLLHFWNLRSLFKVLKKKRWTKKDYVFPKLKTTKDLVRPVYKKRRFRTPFRTQHVKGSQTLVKSAWKAVLSYFTINLREIDLENISLCDMLNLRALCYHTDCWWQVLNLKFCNWFNY